MGIPLELGLSVLVFVRFNESFKKQDPRDHRMGVFHSSLNTTKHKYKTFFTFIIEPLLPHWSQQHYTLVK